MCYLGIGIGSRFVSGRYLGYSSLRFTDRQLQASRFRTMVEIGRIVWITQGQNT
jgi:hypothetical protein